MPIRVTRSAPARGKCVWGRAGRRRLTLAFLVFVWSVASANAQTYSVAWDANTDPFTVGYRVYGGNAPGVYGLWDFDAGAATVATLPPLTPGNAYYFIVRAYNSAGQLGPPSNEVSLDLGVRPGMPRAFAANVAGSFVTLSWSAPAGTAAVTHYLVSVGSSPGASDLVNALSVGTALSVSGTVPPGRYYARVQAVNGYGPGPISGEISFVAGGPDQPGNPSGLSVSWNGTVATLAWTAGAGAASYVLEAGSVPGASDLARIDVGQVTRYVVDVPPGTYHVRVRAVGANGAVSGPSNEIPVQGRGAPNPPTSFSGVVSGSVVDLRWFAPTTGPQPTGYLLEAGSAPGLANLATLQLGLQTRLVVNDVAPGVYHVRVKALNARGASLASNEITVTVR